MNETTCSRCVHAPCAAKVPVFQGLSRAELLRIVHLTTHAAYRRGEIIVAEGNVSETLSIINEGRVKLVKTSRDGREQILRILGPGDFFGELNIFGEGREANFSAAAVTEVKVCSLARERLTMILEENPQIAVKLLGSLSLRLAETENLAGNLASHDADARTAFVLLEMAGKYGREEVGGIRIDLPLNREELAAYAGLTRETLSRRLSDFEKQGVIRSIAPRRIVLVDSAYLQNLL